MDLSKFNIPSLNSQAAQDARKGNNYWPKELAHNGKLAVLGCRFVPQDAKTKSPRFSVRVRVVETDNPAALNREYLITVYITGTLQDLCDNTRAQFFAACMGESSDVIQGQPVFDCDKAMQEILDADEKGELADGSCQIYHRAVSKKGKKAAIKDGVAVVEEKTYCNHYFAPVTA